MSNRKFGKCGETYLNNKYVLSIDYSPRYSLFLLFRISGQDTYMKKSYEYSAERDGYKTDEELYNILKVLLKEHTEATIVIEMSASAASFIECIKKHNEFDLYITETKKDK